MTERIFGVSETLPTDHSPTVITKEVALTDIKNGWVEGV